jgi:hypothetical protein
VLESRQALCWHCFTSWERHRSRDRRSTSFRHITHAVVPLTFALKPPLEPSFAVFIRSTSVLAISRPVCSSWCLTSAIVGSRIDAVQSFSASYTDRLPVYLRHICTFYALVRHPSDPIAVSVLCPASSLSSHCESRMPCVRYSYAPNH